jgi:site-specific recombinase XerD
MAPAARASGAAQVAEVFLRGYRGSTRDAYGNDLAQWFAFCRALGIRPMTANRTAVDAFVQHLEESERRAPATIARRLSTLSSFYRWAVREEWVTRNPATLVARPRVANAAPAPVLGTHALSALLTAAAEDGLRSGALVALLVFNGLRISEALGASARDLTTEGDRPVLRVARRGGTTATVPLTPRTADALARYVGTRTDGPLFVTRTGQPLTRASAWRIVRKLARRVLPGQAEQLSPHSLRRAFIALSLDAGTSLRDVQDAAGHQDPRTTRRYDHSAPTLERHPTWALAAMVE